MSRDGFPEGWDEARVQRVLAHYENESEAEAVAEDENGIEETIEFDLVSPGPLSSMAGWLRAGSDQGMGPVSPKFVIEEVDESGSEIAHHAAQRERARRNRDWLRTHWSEILPQAHVGSSSPWLGRSRSLPTAAEEAWTMAKIAHPDDDGAIDQYVYAGSGPRIYAHRG